MTDPLEALAPPLNPPSFSLVSSTRVPNAFPTISRPYRLGIIGEAPGSDEETYLTPFIGASGRLLDSILGSLGIERAACFVGNVCKYRPPGNDISEWGYDDDRVVEGASELRAELARFSPNCTLLLGNTPLYFAAGLTGITDWRGSIMATSYGKSVAALHPAAVLRDYKSWPLLRWDIKRAYEESFTSELVLPVHAFNLDLTPDEICHRLDTWPSNLPASIDIEGGLAGWICLSVVSEPNHGFIVAFGKHTDSEQARIYQSVSRFLYRGDVPKVLQNALYEGFVLGYGFNMLVRGVREDTMLKGWELYPELPKGLDVQASIWTRQPQWKHLIAYSKKEQDKRRKAGVDPAQEIRNKHLACCIDSSVTLEIARGQDGALSPLAHRHYNFNVSLLPALLYMELKGFSYDAETAKREHDAVRLDLASCGMRLLDSTPQFPIGKKGETTNEIRGAKGSLSSQRLAKVLYECKGYPAQRDGRGPNAKVTTDVDALLKLNKKYPNDPYLADILLHRKLESVRETLEVSADADGRVRCGYNLVGTETGRLTCYTSPTGSGANLQTITKKLRKLYRAAPEYFLFQCDLSGADGWTVAAHCLKHGDSTMWDDYSFGLKPARLVALMHLGIDISKLSRQQLKDASRGVDDDGWLYFACKRVQHATNYGVGEATASKQIMVDSYKMTGKPIYVEPSVVATLQRLYFMRYPGIYSWHNWAKRQVENGHDIIGASGHKRTFFGRRKSWNAKTRSVEADHETWKEFLADEPQENTTYATNLALHRLWYDPENRSSSCLVNERSQRANLLVIQPIHTVHDALIGQFPKHLTSWAVAKIRSYFANPLTIANMSVTIPFDGAYGPSWGELGESYGGGRI